MILRLGDWALAFFKVKHRDHQSIKIPDFSFLKCFVLKNLEEIVQCTLAFSTICGEEEIKEYVCTRWEFSVGIPRPGNKLHMPNECRIKFLVAKTLNICRNFVCCAKFVVFWA